MPEPESVGRNLWSIDEYVVVADLYLRRGRSSGVRDPEVLDLARITGRSPASISRRLGNFDGTVRLGMGLKPVIGEPLAIFQSMQADEAFRGRIVREARERLRLRPHDGSPGVTVGGARLVDPEAFAVEESQVTVPSVTRQMIRAEAALVRRYRKWLDPRGVRLRTWIIPVGTDVLRTDLYDTQLDLLIEAKGAATREPLRQAIGQLIDYRRYLSPRPRLAILLPEEPSRDLAALPNEVGIAMIWAVGDAFEDSAGGELVRRVPAVDA